MRPLIPGKLLTKQLQILPRTLRAFFDLHNGRRNLAQAFIRQADYRNVLDCLMRAQEIFNLYRIQILTAADNDILFPVYQEDKSVLILLRHISRIEPSILQRFFRRLLIMVIAGHHARTLKKQFPHAPRLYVSSILIHNSGLPPISGFTNSSHFMDILYAKMYRAWSDRFAQTIISVILMMRKICFPALNQTWRNRLGADVHQP